MGKCVVCHRDRPGVLPGRACQFCVEKDASRACIGEPVELTCHNNEGLPTILPGICIQLNTSVQTHETSPWCVSLFVFHGRVQNKQDILRHGCGSSQKLENWISHGLISQKSLADAVHMHVAAPWVPKWTPRQLVLCQTKDVQELMLIATGQNQTAVLRAHNNDHAIIEYYAHVLSKSCDTIVDDHKFQNPKDTRFVLLSHGDWDLDIKVGSSQDLDEDNIFEQRPCTPWVEGTTAVWPSRGDPVSVIDCCDELCRTLIGALKLCSVTVCHLDRKLQDNKLDAALLCRWFPEQLQRVFVLEMDGNCVRLLCHGRSLQARVTWMTS